MPIRRPRGPKPTLRHLAFLSGMAETPEEGPAHREARAGFLALRQLDHWIAYGDGGGVPTEHSTEVTAEAIRAVTDDAELRAAYDAIVSAIPTISDVDAQPVLPRVFALGSLLEQRGHTAQAADVYTTVVRYVDPVAHLDLAFDASMRQAACLRQEGELDHADQAYTHAGTLAARTRDRVRVLSSRLGRARVTADRGNLPAAAAALVELEQEAHETGSNDLVAMTLHQRAAVAHALGDFERALSTVWRAFQLTNDAYDRERMLWDLSNFLGRIGAVDASRDALQLITRTTKHREARLLAYQNLMDLASRTGNEIEFHQYRRVLADQPLPTARRVSFLLDLGNGFARFGNRVSAREALTTALKEAEVVGLNQRVFQIESALRALDHQVAQPTANPLHAAGTAGIATPVEIQDGLRELLRESAETSLSAV